jgi:hypothetical protein
MPVVSNTSASYVMLHFVTPFTAPAMLTLPECPAILAI